MSKKSGNSKARDSVNASELAITFTQEIWKEFFPKLARFAREKLGTTPRREFDEEDIALSAINSFFTGVENGKFAIEERDDLWRLLATITARKVTKHNRRFFAEKRGNGKVRGESVFGNCQDQLQSGLDQFVDKNQMPEFQTQIISTCEELLKLLKNEKLRKTALMRMDGYSNQEISDKLACSVARTKQRLKKIKEVWAALENE